MKLILFSVFTIFSSAALAAPTFNCTSLNSNDCPAPAFDNSAAPLNLNNTDTSTLNSTAPLIVNGTAALAPTSTALPLFSIKHMTPTWVMLYNQPHNTTFWVEVKTDGRWYNMPRLNCHMFAKTQEEVNTLWNCPQIPFQYAKLYKGLEEDCTVVDSIGMLYHVKNDTTWVPLTFGTMKLMSACCGDYCGEHMRNSSWWVL